MRGDTGLKGGDHGWEGDGTAWPGYPIASVLPCTSPQTCQALVSLLFGGCPLPPDPAGSPSGRRFPDSTAPGDAYQNRGVRAVPSPSTFLWERAGAGSCVNKQPLPQAAPLRGGGREGQGGQLGVWSWGGESLLQLSCLNACFLQTVP